MKYFYKEILFFLLLYSKKFMKKVSKVLNGQHLLLYKDWFNIFQLLVKILQ